MRGQNTFKNVVSDTDQPKKAKGRNSKQHIRRNECMADRYYYYSASTDKRYDVIIEQLSGEFFLSPATVPDIIQLQMDYIQELKKQKISVYHFQNKWPHLKW
jgi:Fe-S cluster assembly iron-binding protein IscA